MKNDIKKEILDTLKAAIRNPDIPRSEVDHPYYVKIGSIFYGEISLDITNDKHLSLLRNRYFIEVTPRGYFLRKHGKTHVKRFKLKATPDVDIDLSFDYQNGDFPYFKLLIEDKSPITITPIVDIKESIITTGTFKTLFRNYPFQIKEKKRTVRYELTYNGFKYSLEQSEVDELVQLWKEEYERIKILELKEIKNYKKKD